MEISIKGEFTVQLTCEKKMKEVKNFFTGLATASLIDAIKLLALPLIITPITVLSSSITMNSVGVHGWKSWLIIFIVSMMVLWITIVMNEKIRKNRPNFASIKPRFSYADISIEIKYLNEDELIYKKTKKLIALRDGLRSFHDRFHCTGDRDPKFYCVDPAHQLVDRGKRSVWRCYEVDFQKSLKQGDCEKVSVIWDVTNHDGNFVTFISAAIDHPTSHLTLKLDAQSVFEKIERVYVEISPLLGSDDPYKTEKIESDDGVYVFNMLKPKLLHHYEMRWIMIGSRK